MEHLTVNKKTRKVKMVTWSGKTNVMLKAMNSFDTTSTGAVVGLKGGGADSPAELLEHEHL